MDEGTGNNYSGNLNLLVADKNLTARVIEGWSVFTLNSILNYEVVVLT